MASQKPQGLQKEVFLLKPEMKRNYVVEPSEVVEEVREELN